MLAKSPNRRRATRGAALFAAIVWTTVAGAASAEKRDFPAKGTKTCRIIQYGSTYLKEHGNPSSRTLPRPYVKNNGSVEMSLAEDTFPGTKVYYLIGGHRYIGDAGYMVAIDKAGVEASVIQFTYTR